MKANIHFELRNSQKVSYNFLNALIRANSLIIKVLTTNYNDGRNGKQKFN